MKTLCLVTLLLTAALLSPFNLCAEEINFDTTAWRARLNSEWGEGVPTAEKLKVFDRFWDTLNTGYSCFVNGRNCDWDAEVKKIRDKVAAGLTRGGFASALTELTLLMNDGHTFFWDVGVHRAQIKPGLPLVTAHSQENFAACVTPLPDSTALVYEAQPGNVFDLERGDVILGYNGVKLGKLVDIILETKIPISCSVGSTEYATWHKLMTAVACSWHLFDTIDVLKSNGEIKHFPTSLMANTHYVGKCWEALPIEGIERPTPNEVSDRNKSVYSGMIPGTAVGYVAFYNCLEMSGDSLYNHVKELVERRSAKALIIDIRTNLGGTIMSFDKAFMYLYDKDCRNWLTCGDRIDPDDKFNLFVDPNYKYGYDLYKTEEFYFDHPIAVITGPNAISAGDIFPLLFMNHPRVKFFGKSTAGAYGASCGLTIPQHSQFFGLMQLGNMALPKEPNKFLSHTYSRVDFPVWMTREGVAQGKDDPLEAAIKWIEQDMAVEEIAAGGELSIAPTVAKEFIAVKFSVKNADAVRYEITDITGKQALAGECRNLDRINLNALGAGVYFIAFDAPAGKCVKRFLKE